MSKMLPANVDDPRFEDPVTFDTRSSIVEDALDFIEEHKDEGLANLAHVAAEFVAHLADSLVRAVLEAVPHIHH